MSSFTDVYYITGMYASYEKIFAHVDYSIFYIQNLIFCPFFFSPRYLFTSHCPSLGCSLLEVLMLFKLNSGQPSLRTAGPCCEPEWPGPEVAQHLPVCCWACNKTSILHCSAFCQIKAILCPAILLPKTYCISTLLISFKQQKCCQSFSFQFQIWIYRNATKTRIFFLYQYKSFEKNPLHQSQWNWFSHFRNGCLWEKFHTNLSKNYISFLTFILAKILMIRQRL